MNGTPEYVRHALHRSLRHLGTDHVDFCYLHRIDPQVPIQDTVGALAEGRSVAIRCNGRVQAPAASGHRHGHGHSHRHGLSHRLSHSNGPRPSRHDRVPAAAPCRRHTAVWSAVGCAVTRP
ncbi:aldo/keto reductase [Streptomyces sp. NPDC054770]